MKRLRKIIVERSVEDLPYTQEIIARLPHLDVEVMDDPKELLTEFKWAKNPITEGKKFLILERNKGKFIKPFPGTHNYLYCGHYVLNFAQQCNLECSYCILQSYLNNPALRIFTNLEDLEGELETTVDQNPEQFFRISTGVFTDSLALEEVTHFHRKIIPFFQKRKNVALEMKSKFNAIDFVDEIPGDDRVMLAWSLNAPSIQDEEEKMTATLEDRILAAKKARQNGYRVSFHFDPLVYFEGWEDEYKTTVEMLFDHISPDEITWISMGCLRFMPDLKQTILLRHPRSKLLMGEFIKGLDGKMRYPKPIRIKMYREIAKYLSFQNYQYKLYLCMESKEIWEKSLGFSPSDKDDLQCYLHSSFI